MIAIAMAMIVMTVMVVVVLVVVVVMGIVMVMVMVVSAARPGEDLIPEHIYRDARSAGGCHIDGKGMATLYASMVLLIAHIQF